MGTVSMFSASSSVQSGTVNRVRTGSSQRIGAAFVIEGLLISILSIEPASPTGAGMGDTLIGSSGPGVPSSLAVATSRHGGRVRNETHAGLVFTGFQRGCRMGTWVVRICLAPLGGGHSPPSRVGKRGDRRRCAVGALVYEVSRAELGLVLLRLRPSEPHDAGY